MTGLKRVVGQLGMVCLLVWSLAVHAVEWPQQIAADEGTIVVYQPQPEKLAGNLLTGRAAMSLELKNQDEPVFGAFWFSAKLDVNASTGKAIVRDMKVTQVTWPDSTDANESRFTQVVEAALPQAGFVIDTAALSASLKGAELERKSLSNLKNDAPAILFRDHLAVLLMYDGEPRFSDVDNSDYQRALNTPFAVARKKNSQAYYLSSGQFWYSASDPLGPWTLTGNPPADLQKMMPAQEADEQAANGQPPEIVTVTQPSELVVTDGKPEWKSLPGGDLLYVVNTETPWLRDVAGGSMYVLLSGRWFKAAKQDGPWSFVRADELPDSFAQIPPDSDIGGVRTSVAGTPEADDAVTDAYIPETAAIKRSEATLEVTYDGAPEFKSIPGTQVAYAVNTGAQVLKIDNHYYAVDNGVWFESDAAKGPWAVADSIPDDKIQQIPPSSPVYNTTYVHVYESTPEVVYVGYTPGYMWSFPYYGVPVYGTGWYYPPYWGNYYYPRPPTWGFHVGYNPWTGWNFGVSWSNGFFSFGASWNAGWHGPYRPWGCCNGWYGGGYHRPPVVINTGNINIGNSVNIGNRAVINNRIGKNPQLVNRNKSVYHRPENRARNAKPAVARNQLKMARPAPQRANNVFADRNGNVARRVDDNWQVRDKGQWSANHPAASERLSSPEVKQRASDFKQSHPDYQRPDIDRQQINNYRNNRSPSNFDRSGLNRDFQSRQRGMQRSMPRGGGFHGGGGGRFQR
ncbi:carbohydrate-binding family V/XII [Gilvimarinus xylanilyticus]|uniref:Carbohydrate-binding family V/XII n=1 Tax=Gilvimarinus xylanilyticus TaxID=2944139 RepID=A0A9X2HW40_9GAMM|nr:carbohydrate-binding family V/XII [Gilvimarinus xylanilyticus]MCP8898089.1 carbohydrate-binding family V/XII [Gilvimarinus xylanilyticus]